MISHQNSDADRIGQRDLPETIQHVEKEHVHVDDEKEPSSSRYLEHSYRPAAEVVPNSFHVQQTQSDSYLSELNWHTGNSQENRLWR